ncbi:bifunctional 5,10-methylenetetrahydrofolate dehydrogenase/5,10-methenyltetrahydrofolate cyclohydrolase [Deinococcus peraridilitoris]|uniref:Bifunctional protein FolD n=1 Tax=Deinococcus peraridilitoris (strain DSM 19664 / LMG 22246 / CIP 109416 / KR-200) TaxID=937777 RepID=L0A5F0_DEIPD|nr:tetrahydrofolate dehydrogenase/cyclohydrolase catalytic domain-containing protein [Deinococcus peraridilitoris]AFZ69098.1 5,10-methylene-tetrahydrofolate dehydrogenase/methenyl tetrahydrofolate cyclohydrolase [Deinococcus peraridilitoris DSM 19664]
MSARELRGGPAADALLADARTRLSDLSATPHLHVIRLGEDPASVSYVRLKDKKAREIGLHSTVHALGEETSEEALLELIGTLNHDEHAHGILVQLPLPRHVSTEPVIAAIDPFKDVDGFHPSNVGSLWSGLPGLPPCTPAGVMAMLAHYGISAAGRRAVIVGRSNIVGKPLAALLLRADATVTIAHSRTPDLAQVTRQADLLFAAVGRAGLITPEMVQEGAVVVDVGINRVRGPERDRLVGDVHPDVATVASAMTPVPGGVGPLTVAQLLANTVRAAELQHYQRHAALRQATP